mmetsp:Transcript_22358/g.56909  ORF Transcript_22358/g.56909 Transcript_22358/m.56909 type:complete len:84 (-) Transcript_22358:878-1129(-)
MAPPNQQAAHQADRQVAPTSLSGTQHPARARCCPAQLCLSSVAAQARGPGGARSAPFKNRPGPADAGTPTALAPALGPRPATP